MGGMFETVNEFGRRLSRKRRARCADSFVSLQSADRPSKVVPAIDLFYLLSSMRVFRALFS